MALMDLIRELKNGEPDVRKSSTVLKAVGWLCVVAGPWNFILPQIPLFKESPLHISDVFCFWALVSFPALGVLFLVAARGVSRMAAWGKKTGQAAVLLLMADIVVLVPMALAGLPSPPFPSGGFKFVIYLFMAVGFAQFGFPVYYGYRYLGRLPANDGQANTIFPTPERTAIQTRSFSKAQKYKDSPSPFGLIGTFLVMMAILFLIFGITVSMISSGSHPKNVFWPIPCAFAFFFLGPSLFNFRTSPFQKNRRLITAFTGGGSIFLFNGSWPFFRLLVYEDALEVRIMFQRYLIPYAEMGDFPSRADFFSGLCIQSNLPDVPSRIRFSGFGMKNIRTVVTEARNSHLKKRNSPEIVQSIIPE
jgi:hypothetical protein